jgi:hypothetical protein
MPRETSSKHFQHHHPDVAGTTAAPNRRSFCRCFFHVKEGFGLHASGARGATCCKDMPSTWNVGGGVSEKSCGRSGHAGTFLVMCIQFLIHMSLRTSGVTLTKPRRRS